MVKEKNKYAPTHMNYAMNKAALIAKRVGYFFVLTWSPLIDRSSLPLFTVVVGG